MLKSRLRGKLNGKRGASKTFVSLFIAATFALLLSMPDVAIDYMKKGLQLCAHSVVPSLFPFMIISELIVFSGMGKSISRFISPLTKKLFGVGESGACAFLLGTLCGFPVGAGAAASMYDVGDLSSDELERVMTFCNNPSPAFVISTVGASIIGKRNVGVVIYACVVISAITVGIFSNVLSNTKRQTTREDRAKRTEQDIPLPQVFTNAVRHSATSMLTVCAYVAFFSTLVGCLGCVLGAFGGARTLVTLLFGFFELSSGAASAAGLGDAYACAIACALFSGWSGLSVHFQIMSVTAGRGLSYKSYILSKAAQGILCAAICAAVLKFMFPSLHSESTNAFPVIDTLLTFERGDLVCLSFVAASACTLIVGLRKKEKYHGKISLTKARLCDTIHCNIRTH